MVGTSIVGTIFNVKTKAKDRLHHKKATPQDMQYVIEKYNYSRSVQAINCMNCENITMQTLKVTINTSTSTQKANPPDGIARNLGMLS
jgi:hypothetical protein